MRIELTLSDIANGNGRAAHSCPIALAISRQTGISRDDIIVGQEYFYVKSLTSYDEYELPGEARDFIREYDDYWHLPKSIRKWAVYLRLLKFPRISFEATKTD